LPIVDISTYVPTAEIWPVRLFCVWAIHHTYGPSVFFPWWGYCCTFTLVLFFRKRPPRAVCICGNPCAECNREYQSKRAPIFCGLMGICPRHGTPRTFWYPTAPTQNSTPPPWKLPKFPHNPPILSSCRWQNRHFSVNVR
jgi:hypothetical protein